MKRLFVVKKHGKTVKNSGYELKGEAKADRDALGGVEAGFTVSKGPDHKGNHGNRNPHRSNKEV